TPAVCGSVQHRTNSQRRAPLKAPATNPKSEGRSRPCQFQTQCRTISACSRASWETEFCEAFPAQAVAAMGIAKKWERERSAAVIAECGTGKTLISLAALHVHSAGRPFT